VSEQSPLNLSTGRPKHCERLREREGIESKVGGGRRKVERDAFSSSATGKRISGCVDEGEKDCLEKEQKIEESVMGGNIRRREPANSEQRRLADSTTTPITTAHEGEEYRRVSPKRQERRKCGVVSREFQKMLLNRRRGGGNLLGRKEGVIDKEKPCRNYARRSTRYMTPAFSRGAHRGNYPIDR